MKKHNFKYYLAASVSLITFLVYLSSLQNEFVEWDDGRYVFENPHIRSFDLTFFRWSFLDFYAANWHPLTWISHALDYAIWGLNPLGHHLTNNILHAVNTFLVVILVVRLLESCGNHPSPPPSPPRGEGSSISPPLPKAPTFGEGGDKGEGGNRNEVLLPDKPPLPLLNQGGELKGRAILIAAAVTGLLFGLHPLHVESVAWVAERKDLLCALFYLLSVMAYVRYAVGITLPSPYGNHMTPSYLKRGRGGAWGRYLLSLLFFTLALLSKPMAVSLPVVLLILDWYPFNRVNSLKTFRAALIEKIPFIALSLVSSILTIFAQKAEKAMLLMEFVPLSTRMLLAAKSLISYLRKMILPLELLPYYPYPHDASFLSPVYLLPVFLVIGTTILCFVIARKQKLWLSVWGYYVLTLGPVIGIVQVGGQAMADRYTYLPSLGPFLLMGLAGAWISTQGHRLKNRGKILRLAPAAAAVFVFGSLTFLTVNQIGIWKTSIDLWNHVIERKPTEVPIAYNNRGKVFLDKDRFNEAIADFDKAISLDPSYYKAYYNRGISFDKIGRLDEAIADFDKAISLSPSFNEAYYNRGLAYNKTGLFDNAIESFNKSLEIDPNNADAYVNRGISHAFINRIDMALEDFNKAIRLNQNYSLAYFNRGNLNLNQGNRELAMLDFQKACELGDKSGCNVLEALRPR